MFPFQNFVLILSILKLVTFPDRLFLLDLIIIIIFAQLFKLWSPALCIFIQSPNYDEHDLYLK